MRVPTMVHNGAQNAEKAGWLETPGLNPQPTTHEVMSMESIPRCDRTLYAAQYAIDFTDGIKTEIEILFLAHDPMDAADRVRGINELLATDRSIVGWTFDEIREVASADQMHRALTN
jgi:hypothetical protein